MENGAIAVCRFWLIQIKNLDMVVQAFFRELVEAVVFLAVVLRLLEDDPVDLLLVESVDLLDLRLDFFVDALASRIPRAVSSVKSSTD